MGLFKYERNGDPSRHGATGFKNGLFSETIHELRNKLDFVDVF